MFRREKVYHGPLFQIKAKMEKNAKKPEQTDPGPSTQSTQSTKSDLPPLSFGDFGVPDFVDCVAASIASMFGRTSGESSPPVAAGRRHRRRRRRRRPAHGRPKVNGATGIRTARPRTKGRRFPVRLAAKVRRCRRFRRLCRGSRLGNQPRTLAVTISVFRSGLSATPRGAQRLAIIL